MNFNPDPSNQAQGTFTGGKVKQTNHFLLPIIFLPLFNTFLLVYISI